MHAQSIVQGFFDRHLQAIHRSRIPGYVSSVVVVMEGADLTLSRLARAQIGEGRMRAALKRADRLIGCARIEEEAKIVGQALMQRLVASGQPLTIAVDWSSVAPAGKFVELRMVVSWPGMGRGQTIYQQVHKKRKLASPRVQRDLLKQLEKWVPANYPLTVISDAGFVRPWFMQVESFGWSWIGRVRGKVCLKPEGGEWAAVREHFPKATGKAQRWINCQLTHHGWPCDAVVVRKSRTRRKTYDRPGHGPTPKAAAEARASAKEPWILVHSKDLRSLRAEQIVALYSQRMQIEENFRDSKSLVLGMGLEVSLSRSARRLHALLLIGTLAAFLLWHIGQLAEAEGLHRRFRSTTRQARQLSIISLATLLCAQRAISLNPEGLCTLACRLGIWI